MVCGVEGVSLRSGGRGCGCGRVGNGVHGCGSGRVGNDGPNRRGEGEAECCGGKDCYCEGYRCELKCGLKDVSEVVAFP